MKKSLQLFVMRMSAVLICLLFAGAETIGQNVKWALEGTITHEPFHSGLAVFYQDVNGKSLYGAINTSGEVAIQPQFELLYKFYNGMAIAKQDGKYGIVSTSGYWILPPNYKSISFDEEHGFYTVRDDSKAEGIYYNGQFVIPIRYKRLYSHDWPFCSYEDEEGKHKSLNIFTGELFDGFVSDIDNIKYIYIRKDSTYLFFDAKTGERIDGSLFMKSSKDIEAFKDEQTKLYGFRNCKTKQVVTPPKYNGVTDFWVNDMITVFVDNPKHSEIVGPDGKAIALDYSKDIFYQLKGDFIMGFWEDKSNNTYYYSLYTKRGKRLIPLQKGGCSKVEGYDGWFYCYGDKPKVFDAKNNKYYSGELYNYAVNKDGIGKITDKSKGEQDSYYFIDLKNRKRIPGTFSKATSFSEGVAYVETGTSSNRKNFFIDVNGKIIANLDPDWSFNYDGFTEGVIGVQHSYPWVNGYIFNPLGHAGYNYHASSNMKVDENLYELWMRDGKEAYGKQHWGVAKDYFYRVMMNKPEYVDAVIYYGGCLNNLGYYDEAIEAYDIALDIDPTSSKAQEWKETTLRNIENQERRRLEQEEREARQAERSNMFWNALSSFSNMFAGMSTTMSGGTSSSYISDRPLTDSPSVSGGNYQSQYNMWAKRAESNYKSLTNLGYSAKSKSGNRSGGTLQSMNSGSYISMKSSLREAQREMQRIRREAARNGVTIQQSSWETATVKY